MEMTRSLRIKALCAAAALCAATSPSFAQSQGQQISLGEAARRLRAQHKPASSTAKVWTNEDVAKLSVFGVSVVGPLPESLTKDASDRSPAKEAGAPASAEARERELKDTEASLAEEKAHLDTVTNEMDLLRRDLTLAEQQFYSNPGYNSDAEGKAKLDAMNAQIAAKQQEIQKSKDKVTALETKIAKLKAPAAPAPQSPSQP